MGDEGYLSADDIAVAKRLYVASAEKMRDILKQVSRETGVSVDAILGSSKVAAISAARQMVMAISAREGMSTTRIGKLLQRDHTTVMHGIAAHEKRVRSIAQSTE